MQLLTQRLVLREFRLADADTVFRYRLAITLADRVIGTCGVRKESPDATDAELGCDLDPEFWTHGYAREACRAIVAFGFETLGLERILARTTTANHRAIRLAEELGFRRVGLGLYELVVNP